MKIMFIFGTRPEAIKLAPIIKILKKINLIEVKICVTGQHRQMLDQVLLLFDIVPDYDLCLMKSNQSLTDITSSVLIGLHGVFDNWRPDMVIVHGDTNTSFAASLAAFYERIPVNHIEAGLRTGNIYSPWPEEMNRKLTSVIATHHFAPTEIAVSNLIHEGIKKENISLVGNTIVDAVLGIKSRLSESNSLYIKMESQYSYIDKNKKLILVTAHRRENYGEGIEQLCIALKALAERNDVIILYPLHLNPNVRSVVFEYLSNVNNIYLIEPVEYLPFVYLLDQSFLIITDSGGIQEEAVSLGKPVLIIRDTTERPEAVESGGAKLVGIESKNIVKYATDIMENPSLHMNMSKTTNPFGDGNAAGKIVDNILNRCFNYE
jgi:UDP-N-acetylglucosamine 2-epimerase (non-hydrolysing)